MTFDQIPASCRDVPRFTIPSEPIEAMIFPSGEKSKL